VAEKRKKLQQLKELREQRIRSRTNLDEEADGDNGDQVDLAATAPAASGSHYSSQYQQQQPVSRDLSTITERTEMSPVNSPRGPSTGTGGSRSWHVEQFAAVSASGRTNSDSQGDSSDGGLAPEVPLLVFSSANSGKSPAGGAGNVHNSAVELSTPVAQRPRPRVESKRPPSAAAIQARQRVPEDISENDTETEEPVC